MSNTDLMLSSFYTAVAAFRALAASTPSAGATSPSPFVFISAEDIFRPIVPARYIETKREAERIISAEVAAESPASPRQIRPIFVRPSEQPLRAGSIGM